MRQQRRVKYGSTAFLKLKPLLLPFRSPSTVGVGVPAPPGVLLTRPACPLTTPLRFGWVSNAADLKVPYDAKFSSPVFPNNNVSLQAVSWFSPNEKSPSFMRLGNSVINTQSLKFTLCDVTNRSHTCLGLVMTHPTRCLLHPLRTHFLVSFQTLGRSNNSVASEFNKFPIYNLSVW